MGTKPSFRNVLLGTAIPTAKIIIGDVFSDTDDLAIYKCTSVTPVTVVELSGVGSPGAHLLGGSDHSPDTLANLNSKISDATLVDAALPAADRYDDEEALAAAKAGAGVEEGDLVQLDAVGLPAVDGSQLTGIAVEVGGLYGINVEALTDHKTLTPGTDKIYQYLTPDITTRHITLDTGSAVSGDRFVIRHNGAFDNAYLLKVWQAAIVLDEIYAGAIKEFIFDGTNWVSRGIGTGENDSKKYNLALGALAEGYNSGVAIGYYAKGYDTGMAIGRSAVGYSYGVALGSSANGHTGGIAIGQTAKGYSYGIAIGRGSDGYDFGAAIGYGAEAYNWGLAIGYFAKTNNKKYSIALGASSECERIGETSVNINGVDADQENNVVQGRWARDTVNDTPLEIFCAGQNNQRFTIRPSSVLAFEMVIVARDNVANEVARYSVHDGLIKRDGANNTAMVLCTVTVDHEDDASWNVAVTADDTYEALIITVTGDADNPVQWAAVMNGVETHF